jgi:hypothetical protein
MGLILDKNKAAAIWGMAAIGVMAALFLLTLC